MVSRTAQCDAALCCKRICLPCATWTFCGQSFDHGVAAARSACLTVEGAALLAAAAGALCRMPPRAPRAGAQDRGDHAAVLLLSKGDLLLAILPRFGRLLACRDGPLHRKKQVEEADMLATAGARLQPLK